MESRRWSSAARLRAARLDLAHVADVEDPDVAADGQVLLADALVLDRHLPAGERHQPRPGRDVTLVQRGALQGLGGGGHRPAEASNGAGEPGGEQAGLVDRDAPDRQLGAADALLHHELGADGDRVLVGIAAEGGPAGVEQVLVGEQVRGGHLGRVGVGEHAAERRVQLVLQRPVTGGRAAATSR